ncbi:MAG: alpha/beta hydrolase [FCB group bacterium]|nr:alpha/beta hydrolase [FCB group bacterium]
MPVIKINDINLYYEIQGKGVPVLFIHGLGSSARDWEYQVPAFARRFKLYLIDLRGHGKSDKPRSPYSIPLFADDLRAFLDALALKTVSIVGISLGGMVALQFALDHPDRLKKLVLVNSFVELPVKTVRQKLEFWKRLFIVRLMGMRKMGEFLASRLFPDDGQEEIRETFIERWAENDKSVYLNVFKSMAGWTVKDRLEELTLPTLVVSGDRDYTPVAVKEAYTKSMPGARLAVISNSRHGTPVDRPDEFNRCVLEFLNRE